MATDTNSESLLNQENSNRKKETAIHVETNNFGSEFSLQQTVQSIIIGCVITELHRAIVEKWNHPMAVSQHLSRYVLSGWQISCGLALIFEQSQIYRACNNPQAGRVAELAGLAWLCFGVLYGMATGGGFVDCELCVMVVCTIQYGVLNGCWTLSTHGTQSKGKNTGAIQHCNCGVGNKYYST